MNNSKISTANESDIQYSKTLMQKFRSVWIKVKSFFHGNPPAIIGTFILTTILLGAIFAPLLATHNPDKRVARPHLAPSSEHFLGTTRNGRDVYSQVLHGAKKTLSVALFAGVIATIIAVSVGIDDGDLTDSTRPIYNSTQPYLYLPNIGALVTTLIAAFYYNSLEIWGTFAMSLLTLLYWCLC